MATPEEENRLCMTVYPNSISKNFNVNETGPPLMLTSYIKEGYYQEAVDAARVNAIFQTVVRLVTIYISTISPGKSVKVRQVNFYRFLHPDEHPQMSFHIFSDLWIEDCPKTGNFHFSVPILKVWHQLYFPVRILN